jgi:hypothetical protein
VATSHVGLADSTTAYQVNVQPRRYGMALRPKVDPRTERIPINVPVEIHELVKEYAAFLGKDTTVSYVYAEAARKEIRSDKSFRSAREADRVPNPKEDLAGNHGRPATTHSDTKAVHPLPTSTRAEPLAALQGERR